MQHVSLCSKHVEEFRRGRENGGINKLMNGTVAPPQQFRNVPVASPMSSSQPPEPIYENIPLPWASESREPAAEGDCANCVIVFISVTTLFSIFLNPNIFY